MSIGYKMILYVYCSTLFIFTLLSFVLFNKSCKIALNEFISNSVDMCESGNILVNNNRSYMMGIADYCSLSEEVQNILILSNKGEYTNFSEELISRLSENTYISTITFYNLKGIPIGYISIDSSSNPLNQNPLDENMSFGSLISKKNAYVWEFIDAKSPHYMKIDNSPKLCLWYAIKQSHSTNVIGVIAITLDSRKLLGTNALNSSVYNELLILDSISLTSVVNHTKNILTDEDIVILVENSTSRKGYYISKLSTGERHVFYHKVPESSLIIFRICESNTYKKYAGFLFKDFLIAIFCLLLMLLPLLFLTSHILIKPLKILRNTMIQFAKGDFNAHVNFKHNDEIGELGKVFNEMTYKQKLLLEQTVLLKTKKQEAELAALESQINPHFLYNILNSIMWTALKHGEDEIADMAYSLGKFFRLSLNHGNEFITIAEEKDLILYYLKLQKYRYNNRIEYKISCDDNILGLLIPKLIIQPLVENSVVHGTENTNTTVNICINIYTELESVIIIVKDNGTGIQPEILKLLPKNFNKKSKAGNRNRLALKNISERLDIIYGGAANFDIKSQLGRGTKVTIKLPIAKMQSKGELENAENSYCR